MNDREIGAALRRSVARGALRAKGCQQQMRTLLCGTMPPSSLTMDRRAARRTGCSPPDGEPRADLDVRLHLAARVLDDVRIEVDAVGLDHNGDGAAAELRR